MLQVAQPWPEPSQAQLLETLQGFRDADSVGTGTATREQFEQVGLPGHIRNQNRAIPRSRQGYASKGIFEMPGLGSRLRLHISLALPVSG